ncbi:MAG: metallophosphoesterase [Chitinophagaceae bacterium]|nr:metallophosphoesterase [Chitinophagaceae bacterium]
MYDLIGDIHGHSVPLKTLLQTMDYIPINGIWRHENRKAVFVGDYIDRGPAIREVLSIVRGMVDNGHALALLGNHEYNALGYAFQLPNGQFLRSHNAVHTKQHQATLDQFRSYQQEWKSYLDWFATLPLFAELNGIRAVHACWDDDHIQWLKDTGNTTMNTNLLLASFERGNIATTIIEETLKGKEFNIPEKYSWHDKDGHPRNSNRLRWWINPDAVAYGDFLFNCPPELRDQPVNQGLSMSVYPADAPPVFFGHYWMEDKFPVIQSVNVICLDYSVAKGGHLVAYRWYGEPKLNSKNFVTIPGG